MDERLYKMYKKQKNRANRLQKEVDELTKQLENKSRDSSPQKELMDYQIGKFWEELFESQLHTTSKLEETIKNTKEKVLEIQIDSCCKDDVIRELKEENALLREQLEPYVDQVENQKVKRLFIKNNN